VLLALVAAAWAAWLAFRTRSELLDAKASAHDLSQALADGDNERATASLREFTTSVDSAHRNTRSVVWRVADHLPFVGDDARAVATVADVGHAVAHEALAPLVAEANGGIANQLAPHGGRFDLGALQRLQPVLARARRSFDTADVRLADVHRGGLLGGVRGPLDDLGDQLGNARSGLDAADRAVTVLPSMLGADGPRQYLLMFNNNAEVRATGGMPGAWGLLRASNGRLDLVRQGSAREFGELPEPVLPQSPAEKAIYDVLPAVFFQDTNFTPEFPRTAELAREMFQRKYGDKVSGVVGVDTVTLGYIIGATGDISVPGGPTLTQDNAAATLLNGVYRALVDPDAQDAYFAKVARTVFDNISSGVDSPTALAKALAQSVREGRLHIHSFFPKEQAELDGSMIAGNVDFSHGPRPQVGVYVNDATGSKMSYYLRTRVRMTSDRCDGGAQALTAYADFQMVQPAPGELNAYITGGGEYGTPAGQQLVLVRVYGPAGGRLSDFEFDGKPIHYTTVVDRGRPVVTTVVQLTGGQTVHVRWSVDTDEPGRAQLSVTPGLGAEPATRDVPSTC
jgi:hypothetical protein